MNKILVIAVAAVVVAGGVGAAIFFMNQNKSSDDFSFKDCHFDLSGAKSLVIAKDSAVSSTSSMVSKNYGGDVGAATPSFGADESYDYSLYKTDEYGHYIKVLLYGNDTTDGEGNAIDFNMVPILMEISDDGKYILMAFSKPDNIHRGNGSDSALCTYVMITLPSGKVYQLNDDRGYTMFNQKYTGRSLADVYYGQRSEFAYKIVGSVDSKVIMKHVDNQQKFGYVIAYVDNDELVVKDLLNSSVISNLSSTSRIYNNGILRVRTETTPMTSYLVFPDGGLKNDDGSLDVYCNYLCTSITYYDTGTKFFASSFNAVKSLNKETNQYVTEEVTLTQAQSFEMMKKNPCRSELYREVTDTEITVYAMETIGHVYKFKLKSDCTVEDLGRITLPFDLAADPNYYGYVYSDKGMTNHGDYLDNHGLEGFKEYAVINGHVCQNGSLKWFTVDYDTFPGDIVVSGSTMFKLTNGNLTAYDLKTGSSEGYSIGNIVKVNSMEIINDKVIIEGVTNTGSIMKGSLDLGTKQIDASYTNVLTEVRLTALN